MISVPLMILIIFFFLLISPANAISFNFSSFGPSTQGIKLEGNASFLDSAIQLTGYNNFVTGYAKYSEPIQLWEESTGNLASFITNFTYSIDARNNVSRADGFAFFLVNMDFKTPAQQGSGLGLASGNQTENSTSNPFVAAEFDTNYNAFDVDRRDHVGIDVNSLRSTKTWPWDSSLDGRIMNAAIMYDSASKNFCVYFEQLPENILVVGQLCDEIDLREYLHEWVIVGFSAATGTYAEVHTIHSWSFNSTFVPSGSLNFNSTDDKYRQVMIAGWSVAGLLLLVLVSLIGGMIWFYRKMVETHPPNIQNVINTEFCQTSINGIVEEAEPDTIIAQDNKFRRVTGAKNIPYNVLFRATDGFNEERKLGQGGSGDVYKGYLSDLDMYVAVKRISADSVQGIAQYTTEVMTLSQLRHRNLVQLIGWCHESNQILVVYEYLPNRSLDLHLHSQESILKWELRYKIIKGLAEGLQYLHNGWRSCVLHRDIKPSNVMLDSEFNPMLGDFGLARIIDHDARSQTLQGGSHGYIAPECIDRGRSSKESDVFSFGVVALELASGRKPFVEREDGTLIHLVKWVWELYGSGRILEAADQKLNGEFTAIQMECLVIVGLWCAHPDSSLRPLMREVINVLSFDFPMPDLPLEFPASAHSPPSQE